MRLFSSMPRTVAAGLLPVAAAVALGQGGAFTGVAHDVFGSNPRPVPVIDGHVGIDLGANGVWAKHGRPILSDPSPTPSDTPTSASPTPTVSATPTVVPTTVTASPTVVPTTSSPTASPTSTSTGPLLPWAPLGDVFGLDSVWRQDVAGAPENSNSAAMVAGLDNEVTSLYNGVAAFNVASLGTNFYTVGPDTPTVNVGWDNCQDKDYTPTGLLGPGGQFTAVPIPTDAVADLGTDEEMTIYQPSSNTMWEFWVAQKSGSNWTACWGGRMNNVSTSPGYFSGGWGATATGLPVAGGMISIQDAQAGVIDHAMSLEIPDTAEWYDFSYPAQRADGDDTASNAIPEGTRIRLSSSVDVDALNLTPIARMVAKAAQTYGFIVTDTAGAVAIQAESGVPMQTATGVDPWNQLMNNVPSYDIFANFPWSQMQVVTANWGKP